MPYEKLPPVTVTCAACGGEHEAVGVALAPRDAPRTSWSVACPTGPHGYIVATGEPDDGQRATVAATLARLLAGDTFADDGDERDEDDLQRLRVQVPGGEPTPEALAAALEIDSDSEPGGILARFRAVGARLVQLMPEEYFERVLALLDELVALRKDHPRPMAVAGSTDGESLVQGDPAIEAHVEELLAQMKAAMEAGVKEGQRRQMEPKKTPPPDHGPS